jgi:hypothetical protein
MSLFQTRSFRPSIVRRELPGPRVQPSTNLEGDVFLLRPVGMVGGGGVPYDVDPKSWCSEDDAVLSRIVLNAFNQSGCVDQKAPSLIAVMCKRLSIVICQRGPNVLATDVLAQVCGGGSPRHWGCRAQSCLQQSGCKGCLGAL